MSSTDGPSTQPEPSDGVTIVGAGFAGVACAQRLGSAGVDVTLIDRNTYHQFQPLLYQVASAQLAATDVMRPLRGLFRKYPTVNVKNAEVTSIDPLTRSVTVDGGQTFAADHLVLAAGCKPNFFGVSGAATNSFPLYSADDAARLRNRVLQLFEDADLEPGLIDRGALNIVIVGAGPTGVETAGALADLVRDVLPSRYHDLSVSSATITLVDHGPHVLAPFSDKAHAYAEKVLTERGVRLMLSTSVAAVEPDRVVFDDGTHVLTHCVVWAGGLKVRTIDGTEQLPVDSRGRIVTQQDLSVAGFPGVHAVGDGAHVADPDGAPYPQLGAVALQEGHAVADTILAVLDGRPAPDFDYHDKGFMAMIGRGAAVAELGAHHHELHGSIAFGTWLGVHAWLLNTTRARLDAFVSWGWNTFTKSRGPAIIDDADGVQIDWGDDDADPSETRVGATSEPPNPPPTDTQGVNTP